MYKYHNVWGYNIVSTHRNFIHQWVVLPSLPPTHGAELQLYGNPSYALIHLCVGVMMHKLQRHTCVSARVLLHTRLLNIYSAASSPRASSTFSQTDGLTRRQKPGCSWQMSNSARGEGRWHLSFIQLPPSLGYLLTAVVVVFFYFSLSSPRTHHLRALRSTEGRIWEETSSPLAHRDVLGSRVKMMFSSY